MTQLLKREFTARLDTKADRIISGIGVPFGETIDIGGYKERIAPGAVMDRDNIMLFYGHSDPIGKVLEHNNDDDGWRFAARISETTLGNDVYTLAKDEVLTKFSIGFIPIEDKEDEDGTIVRTQIDVREVSIVPLPAYEGASVEQVREAQAPTKEDRMNDDLIEVRDQVDALERKFATLTVIEPAPVADNRSAGEVWQAIARGDAETINSYENMLSRAYTGGTSADAIVKPGWVGDLTRIFDASSGVLADVFSTGTLPSQGNSIEFARLTSNTVDVAEQVAEGDDLTSGKVVIDTDTAPVKTYGGLAELTRQSIERANVGVLNTTLEALATAAGARKKAVLRTAYNTLVTAREGIAANGGVVVLGAVLGSATAGNWEDALIDAALKFETQGLEIDALIVSGSVFKKLRSLTVAGERVFQVANNNASGKMNLKGLSGDFAGLPVRLDSGQAGDKAVFVNGRAIRQYDSALVSLTDDNIVNLSKTYGVYKYGAVAAELPAGVVPVKLAAS